MWTDLWLLYAGKVVRMVASGFGIGHSLAFTSIGINSMGSTDY